MNAPKEAWKKAWTRKSRTRRRVTLDAVAVPAPAVAVSAAAAAAGVPAWSAGFGRPSAGGFGRNSEAIAESVLVAPTTRNGSRRSDTPTSRPPTVGPRTAPAEPAAERTPLANASRVRSMAWATYSRSDTWLTPVPSPATARKAISDRAVPAVAIRTFAAAYVPIPIETSRRGASRSTRYPPPSWPTAMVTAKPLVNRPRTGGVAPSEVAYNGRSGSMIDTPTWVMNAIAPSSAIAGERPRPHVRTRLPILARANITAPSSRPGQQGASDVRGSRRAWTSRPSIEPMIPSRDPALATRTGEAAQRPVATSVARRAAGPHLVGDVPDPARLERHLVVRADEGEHRGAAVLGVPRPGPGQQRRAGHVRRAGARRNAPPADPVPAERRRLDRRIFGRGLPGRRRLDGRPNARTRAGRVTGECRRARPDLRLVHDRHPAARRSGAPASPRVARRHDHRQEQRWRLVPPRPDPGGPAGGPDRRGDRLHGPAAAAQPAGDLRVRWQPGSGLRRRAAERNLRRRRRRGPGQDRARRGGRLPEGARSLPPPRRPAAPRRPP